MTDTIKAELVYYRIDTSQPEGDKAYEELCKSLREIPFKTWVTRGRFPNGATNFELQQFINSLTKKLNINFSRKTSQAYSREINLKIDHLFDDQWNTIEGFRLHNKASFVWPALHIKEGYYIRQNQEMIGVLQSTAECGYCGHQAPIGEKDFCDKCLHSSHLGGSNLHLIRMEPIEKPERRAGVTMEAPKRAPLTQEELAVIMPRYVEAQTKLQQEKEAKLRASIKRTLEERIELAETEAKGMLWLLDAGISVENLIFYPHTKTFCFGWRQPVSKEIKAELVEKLKEFPLIYEIK